MASLDDFKPQISPEVPGCPDPLLEQTLKNVIDDFCRQSWVWQEDLEPVYVFEGVKEYDLVVPIGMQIAGIVRLKDENGLTFRDYVFDRANEVIQFKVSPPGERAYIPVVALRPSKGTNATYKDFLLDEWIEPIASGVKARLMVMPGQNFSNPELATYYSRLYQVGLDKAKIEGNRLMHGERSLSVKPKRFV